jgi:hypothetical protein
MGAITGIESDGEDIWGTLGQNFGRLRSVHFARSQC